MLTRRELVVAGGLALAGRLLPSSLRAGEAHQATAEIAMRAAGGGARVWFDPVGLLVQPGTTVRWALMEGVHTTTAYHPANGDLPRRIPEGARPWDSRYLTDPGTTFEVTLDVEGVYDFFCRPHEAAGMVGRIVVTSDADDRSRLEPSAVRTDAATSPTKDGRRLPAAARNALPTVDDILRRQTIRPPLAEGMWRGNSGDAGRRPPGPGAAARSGPRTRGASGRARKRPGADRSAPGSLPWLLPSVGISSGTPSVRPPGS